MTDSHGKIIIKRGIQNSENQLNYLDPRDLDAAIAKFDNKVKFTN